MYDISSLRVKKEGWCFENREHWKEINFSVFPTVYVKYSLWEMCNLFMYRTGVDYGWLWGTKPGQKGLWVNGLVLSIVAMTDKHTPFHDGDCLAEGL